MFIHFIIYIFLRRCCDEATPMHVASLYGSISLIVKLIEAGGDLRLHDKHNRTVAEWAAFGHDEKKRRKMIEFLKKAQDLAISKSTQKTLYRNSSNILNL